MSSTLSTSGRRLPGASLFLALPALVIALVPGLASRLDCDRQAVAAGEVWRLATGHWVHWSADHLAWDLAAFAGLAAACELLPGCGRRRMLVAVGLAAIAIPAVLWIALPGMPTYRGLSGIDSALFALLVVTLFREDGRAGRRGWALTEVALLVLFLGKCAYETWTGRAFFAAGGGFVPVPLAHLVGGLAGLGCVILHGKLFPASEVLTMPGDLVGAAMKGGESTPRPARGGGRGEEDREALERAVSAFQRGADREAAFAELFHRFRPRVERFLCSRVFSPEERLDLTQIVFLRIYQGLEGFRGEGSLEGWLLQIVFNVYRKWRDRQPGGPHAGPEVALDPAAAPEPTAALESSPAEGASPLDQAVRRERMAALREAVSGLPQKQRLCMELRVYQERSIKEIAAALRISPETVKAHLFQARQRLGERLHDTFGTMDF